MYLIQLGATNQLKHTHTHKPKTSFTGMSRAFSGDFCLCWGRAKGAAKGSCGETVVQKGVFGESVSSLPP